MPRSRSHQKPGSLSQGESAPFWVASQPNCGVTWPPITYLKHALFTWRIRFITYVKHAPSFDESGSSYIYNTPSHLASPVHNIFYTCPFIWQFRLLIYLKYAPSFGHSGSTYILNTPSHRRFQSIIYLKHAPSFGDSGSSCLVFFLNSFLLSFRAFLFPFFLPCFLPSFLSSFLPFFLPSFPRSWLLSFLPAFLSS